VNPTANATPAHIRIERGFVKKLFVHEESILGDRSTLRVCLEGGGDWLSRTSQRRARLVAPGVAALRIQLKNTSIIAFQLAPSITQTPLFSRDISADDVRGVTPIDVNTLAKCAINGIKRDRLEIRPGLSNMLNVMSRLAPNRILLSGPRELSPCSSHLDYR